MSGPPSEEDAQQIEQVIAQRGVTGAHLLAETEIGQQLTAEKAARGGADQILAGALIFEGTDEAAVREVTERCAARLSSDFSPIFLLQHFVM